MPEHPLPSIAQQRSTDGRLPLHSASNHDSTDSSSSSSSTTTTTTTSSSPHSAPRLLYNLIPALTPSSTMSGSSPGSSSHKRKVSDLEDDASGVQQQSGLQHSAPQNIAPSYSFAAAKQHVSPLSQSPSQSATGLTSSTPDGTHPQSSGSMLPSRSNTLDSHRSKHSPGSSKPMPAHPHPHPHSHPQLQVTGHHGLQSNTGGNKRIKTARACDSCRRKKIRCDVIEDGSAPGDPNNGNGGLTCAHCRQYGFECTFFLPITETRFKKKREREREAEMAATVAAVSGMPGMMPTPGMGPSYGVAVAPGSAAPIYRTSSGGFYPPGAMIAPGAPVAGLPHTVARHIPAASPQPHLINRYGPMDAITGHPTGAMPNRLSSQEWPPAPPLPLPSGSQLLGSSYRSASWREAEGSAGQPPPPGASRSYSAGASRGPAERSGPPRRDSPPQRPDGASGPGAQHPPDARVLGPTSIAYIVHSQPFVPGAAIEAHDIKHHQTFEVGASGDGIIKFNRPPRRASATSGDDDDGELTAATEVANAANADGTPLGDNKAGEGADGEGNGKATPNASGDTKVGGGGPSLVDKVATRQISASAANSPGLAGSGLARVRLAADVAEKLTNVYFSRLANMFPVVTKAEFLHLSPPPPLLLYAVCGIAALSREVPREVLLCVKTCLTSIFRETDVLSTSKGNTVRALLVLSLHSDVHGSTAMQSGARCWNRTGCAVRMAQDLGLHRDATGRDDEDDDQFFLEQKRRMWGCCVTADRILSISLGHPLAIDLTDCDVRLPSPYEVKRWADDPPADPSTDRPFAFNTEMLKLSILFGRVMKTIYSPTGLMKTTDEEISGLLRDIDTWRELLPPELQFAGLESSPQAGILHVAFACLQMLFWRVFLRISYICPTHLKFSLNIERMTLLITWSREAILWVDRNDFYLDTLQLVSYSLVFCATVQYHAWVRRGEKEALEILRTCRDCVNRSKRPGDDGEDLSMRAKTAGVITMLYEAASGVYANSPVGSQLNPTAGVINRRAVETLRGIVFRADSSRPGGGVYVAADQDHLLQDLPTGTIIHETSKAGAGGGETAEAKANAAASAAAAAQQAAAAAAAAVASGGGEGHGISVKTEGESMIWNGNSGPGWPGSGDASGGLTQSAGPSGDASAQPTIRQRRASKNFGAHFASMVDGGFTSFQIPPEAGMGRAVTAHISENGPIQLELQQPPYIPSQTSSGFSASGGNVGTSLGRLGGQNASGVGDSGSQPPDATPFSLNGADANMMFLQSMNVNPLLNELHWPSQPIMVAGGPELLGNLHAGVSMAGGSMAGAGGGMPAPASVGDPSSAGLSSGNNAENAGGVHFSQNAATMTSAPSNAQQQQQQQQQQQNFMFDGPMLGSGGGGQPNGAGAGFGMGVGPTSLDPSVIDGLPVSGLDFGAWDNFFSRFSQFMPNGDGTPNGGAGAGAGPGDGALLSGTNYGSGTVGGSF